MERLKQIFKWYGWKHQLKKLKEEQKEFRQAIKWYYKHGKCNIKLREHLIEEAGDEMNVMWQFLIDVNASPEEIKDTMLKKQIRQISRINRGK